MSEEVDRRVVEMQFRNGDFERNANATISTLDKLKNSLVFKGTSEGIEKVSDAISKVPIPGLATAVEQVSAKFSALQVIGVTALANITNSAVNAGKQLVSSLTIAPIHSGFSEYELKMNSTRVIMSSTGESIEKVNGYLEELNKYSDETIYSFSDMTNNIGKFTNAGVKLEDAVAAIKGISNEAAVSGANAAEASRAMYNFAQALSQGSVKLIDWKSIENANMSTMEFKQQLIDTALEVGTLTKEGEKYISTTVDLTGHTSEAFNSTQMFNESLSSQWMTTDVLIKTLKKYSDKTTDIGKKAYEAAGEVTTLSKMMDTLNETAQSGWAKTWEIMFGDIETAKKLFTPLTKTISGIITAYDDFRNNLLEGALSKSPIGALMDKLDTLTDGQTEASVEGVTKSLTEMQDVVNRVWRGDYGLMQARWNLLDSEGYDSKVVQSLVNLGYKYSLTVDDVNSAYAKYGKLAPTVIKATDGLKKSVETLSDAQLKEKGLTDDEIKMYRDLEEQSKKTGKSISELVSRMGAQSGRELLVDGFSNIGKSIINTFTAIKDAWVDAFPPPTSTQIYNLIKAFDDFTKRVMVDEKKMDELTRTFKGLFAILDLVATIIGGPIRIALKVVSSLLKYFNVDVLTVTAKIGDAIAAFRDWVESLIDFNKVASVIGETIEKIAGYVTDWWTGFANAPDKFKYVADSIATIAQAAVDAISKWFTDLKNSDTIIGNIIQGFENGIASGFQTLIQNVVKWVTDLVTAVKEKLGIHSPSTVFFDIGSNVLTGFLNGLRSVTGEIFTFIRHTVRDIVNIVEEVPWDKVLMGAGLTSAIMVARRLSKAVEAFTSPLASLSEFIENLSDSLEVLTKSVKGLLKAKQFESYGVAFKSFATGLLLVAGAVWLLSTIDEDSLKRSVGVLAILAGLMTAMTIVFSKIKGVQPLSILGVVISLSLLLSKLAAVLVICAVLKPEALGRGLLAMTLMTALVSSMLVVARIFGTGPASQTLVTIKGVANVLAAMALAMKLCGSMSDEAYAKGLGAVTAFSLIIVGLMAATKLMSNKDIAKATGIFSSVGGCLIMMAVAAKIAGSMSAEEIVKGIVVVGCMTGLMIALMTATRLMPKRVMRNAASVFASLGVCLLLMTAACKIAGSMSTKEIKTGLTVVSVLSIFIVGLIAATRLFPERTMKSAGATILALSAAIGILAIVCALMGTLEPEQITKGLTAVGFLSAFMAVLMKASKGVRKAASTAIAIAVAVGILAAVAAVIGMLPPEQIATGVAALDALMVGLAIVFASAKKIEGKTGAILAISVAIAAMGGAVWLISQIDTVKALASTGMLIALMTDFTVCLKMASKTNSFGKSAIAGVGVMTGVAAVLTGLIILLSECADGDNAIKTTACLAVLLPDLVACVLVAGKAKMSEKGVMRNLAIMLAVATGCAGILVALDKLEVNVDIETVGSLCLLLDSLVGAVFIASKIKGGAAKGAADALGGIAIFIGGFSAIFSAFELIRRGFDEGLGKGEGATANFLQGGIDLMILVGKGIGDFVGAIGGGIVDGFATVSMEAFPKMGKALADFMTNAQPFFTGIKNCPDNIGDKVGSLAVALLAITAADIMRQFAAFFGVSGSMTTFADGIKDLGVALVNFYETIKPLDEDAVDKIGLCADACVKLADVAKAIPSEGGLWAQIFGEKDLKSWAPGLTILGENLVSFSKSVNTLTEEDLGKMETASDTVQCIADMAGKIPNEGGWWAKVFGDNSLKTWAPQLPILGANLVKFADSVKDMDKASTDKMTDVTAVVQGIVDMASKIPNEGMSLAKIFVGDNDLGTWSAHLGQLGSGIASFSREITGLDLANRNKMNGCVDILSGIVDVSVKIASAGKDGLDLFSFLPDTSLSTWSAQLGFLGKGLTNFASNVKGIGTNAADAMRAGTIAGNLATATANIPTTGWFTSLFEGVTDVKGWSEQLPAFGKGVKGFADEVEGIKDVDKLSTVTKIATTLSEITDKAPKVGGVASWFTGVTDLDALSRSYASLGRGLRSFAGAIDGTDSVIGPDNPSTKVNKFIDFTSDNLDSAVNIAKALSEIYTQIGTTNTFEYMVDWFVNGGDKMTMFASSVSTLGTALGQFVVGFFDSGADKYTMSTEGTNGTTQIESVLDIVSSVCTLVDSGANDKIFNATSALDGFVIALTNYYDTMDYLMTGSTNKITQAKEAGDTLINFVNGFNTTWCNSASTSISKLVDVMKGFDGIKLEDVQSFVDAIKALGTITDDDVSTNRFSDLYKNLYDLGAKMVNSLVNGIKSKSEDVANGLTSVFTKAKTKLTGTYTMLTTLGKAFASKIGTGISDGWEFLKTGLASAITRTIVDANNNQYSKFKDIGRYMMQGFADGMTAMTEDISAAAEEVAQAGVDAMQKKLDIHSPSRVLARIGNYAGMGFIAGLSEYEYASYQAGSSVADNAINGASETMSQIQNILASGFEWSPVITPVMDLSGIQNGANAMQNMLDSPSMSVSLAGNVSATMAGRSVDCTNTDVVNAINKLYGRLESMPSNTYNVNGVTYDDGSNVSMAVSQLCDAIQLKRRT